MANEYQSCIDACYQCAEACDRCAVSCLQEPHLEMMRACIKTDMECAALCRVTAQLLSLESEQVKQVCRICADACRACAEECSKHQHDHCQQCAAECRRCAEVCMQMTA